MKGLRTKIIFKRVSKHYRQFKYIDKCTYEIHCGQLTFGKSFEMVVFVIASGDNKCDNVHFRLRIRVSTMFAFHTDRVAKNLNFNELGFSIF